MIYKKLKKCRLCDSDKLKTFIDFKRMPLAGAFLSKSQIKNNFYTLWQCNFVIAQVFKSIL